MSRRGLARFNKRVVNRVQGLWAPWLPPWTVIVHKGRTSGTVYRTPVLAWRSGDRLEVVLYYGAESDWVRNVLAVGEAGVVRRGKTLRLTGAHVVDASDPSVTGMARRAAIGRQVLIGELSP